MKRRKSPPEKKKLAYKKDHLVAASEYPHVFRRQWRQKKARSKRKVRRQVRQLFANPPTRPDGERLENLPPEPVQRDVVKKWPGSAIPLATWVKDRLRRKAFRAGWNFFKSRYNSQKHREKFVLFLESLIVDTQSVYAREVAWHFDRLLTPPHHRRGVLERSDLPEYSPNERQKRAWLRAFLRDEPEWQKRLRNWIARCLEEIDKH